MIQEASVTGLVRMLLIFVAVYYLFKFFKNYILPGLIVKTAQKMESKLRQELEKQNTNQEKEGTTIIDKRVQENANTKNVGEYIEFEEID